MNKGVYKTAVGIIAAASTIITGLTALSPTAQGEPTQQIHVSASRGNDAGDGSQTHPYRTIRTALKTAKDGADITVEGGTYREGELWATKTVNLHAKAGEQAVLSGAEVPTNWVQDGRTYRADNQVRHCTVCTVNSDPRREGLAAHPEQVYVDGKPLRQVLSLGEVDAGSFYVADSDPITTKTPNNNTSGYNVKPHRGTSVHIGVNPAGHMVEVVSHSRALTITGNDVELSGFRVEKYAPLQSWNYRDPEIDSLVGGAMVFVVGQRNHIHDNTFTQSTAATALALSSSNGSNVHHNQFTGNGGGGFGINRASDVTVEYNTWSSNNQAGFITSNCGAYCTLGDTKITHSERIRYAYNTHDYSSVGYDNSDPNVNSPYRLNGVWFDEGVMNSAIVNNFFTNVGRAAIMDEVSSHNVIASNIIEASNMGVLISGSDRDDLYNNTIDGTLDPIVIQEDDRTKGCNARNTDGSCQYPESWSVAKGLSWDTTDTKVYNNIISNKQTKQLSWDKWRHLLMLRVTGHTNWDGSKIYANQMISGIDNNTYVRASTQSEPYTLHWHYAPGNGNSVSFNAQKVSDFTSNSNVTKTIDGREAYASDIMRARGGSGFYRNQARNITDYKSSDYRLADRTQVRTGRGLPPHVAKAIDPTGRALKPNVVVDRGALLNYYQGFASTSSNARTSDIKALPNGDQGEPEGGQSAAPSKPTTEKPASPTPSRNPQTERANYLKPHPRRDQLRQGAQIRLTPDYSTHAKKVGERMYYTLTIKNTGQPAAFTYTSGDLTDKRAKARWGYVGTGETKTLAGALYHTVTQADIDRGYYSPEVTFTRYGTWYRWGQGTYTVRGDVWEVGK